MPSYNVTREFKIMPCWTPKAYRGAVDDVSPLWRYSDNWNDSDKADGAIIWYSNQTFHSTSNVVRVQSIMQGAGLTARIGINRRNHFQWDWDTPLRRIS